MNHRNIVGINGQTKSGKDTIADCFVENGYAKIALADPMKRFAHLVFGFTEYQLWGPSELRNIADAEYYPRSRGWSKAEKKLELHGPNWIEEVLKGAHPDDQIEAFTSLCEWFDNLHSFYPHLSPRICLQLLGTEWGRDVVHKNVWVEYFLRVSNNLLSSTSYTYNRLWGLNGVRAPCRGIIVPDVRYENELRFFKDRECRLVRVSRQETDSDSTSVGVIQHTSETEQQDFSDSLFDEVIRNDGTLTDLVKQAQRVVSVFGAQER
jgi:hypothetical protein